MSLMQSETVACPACGKRILFDVIYSLNADRRPDLRAAIIDGTLQQLNCPKCAATFRMEPEMTYLHVARNQWLLVQPVGKLPEWRELEQSARDTFEAAYGSGSPKAVREIGAALKTRVTFGWAALREKLICEEQGLDDVTLELLKLAIVRSEDSLQLTDDSELRLVNIEGDQIVLAWIQAASEALVETLRAPRSLYNEIAGDQNGWKALREEVSAGPYVDFQRLLVAETEETDDEDTAPAAGGRCAGIQEDR